MLDRDCPICKCSKSNVIRNVFKRKYDVPYKIVQCDKCSFYYVTPQMTHEEIIYRYEEWSNFDFNLAKILEQKRTRNTIIEWLKLYQLLDITHVNHILDYGCGFGLFLKVASAFNVEVFGYDINKKQTAWAKEQGLEIIDSLKCILPGSLDMIHFTQVLEHIYDPLETLQLFHKLLKPDGILYVTIPNCTDDFIINDVESKDIEPSSHVNYFTAKSFESTMKLAGFSKLSGDNTTGVIARK